MVSWCSPEPFQQDSHPKLCVFGDTHSRLKQYPEELFMSFYGSVCKKTHNLFYVLRNDPLLPNEESRPAKWDGKKASSLAPYVSSVVWLIGPQEGFHAFLSALLRTGTRRSITSTSTWDGISFSLSFVETQQQIDNTIGILKHTRLHCILWQSSSRLR